MNSVPDQLRQDTLLQLSKQIRSELIQNSNELKEIKTKSKLANAWFEEKEVDRMLEMIYANYLDETKLLKWLSQYTFEESHAVKTIGIVAAGNIPLASFQDVWCALACGYHIQLKLSSKDQFLSRYIYEKINSCLPESHPKIEFVEKLTNIDGLMASGSNLTANHFKNYEHRFPCLIRSHRNGIAILSGKESETELVALGNDVFSYFGLGCRNVSKIYIPDKAILFNLARIFDIHFAHVRNNFRYNNNYDYQLAILSLSKNTFYQGSSIFFKESTGLNAAIAVLNYEIFDSLIQVEVKIKNELENIQCISSNIGTLAFQTVKLGAAQWPELWDYQDRIDVIHFLQSKL